MSKKRSEAKKRSITCIRLRYRTAQLFSLTFRNNLRVDFGNFSSGPELLPMLIKRVLFLAARSWNSNGFVVLASFIACQIVASLHWMRVCNDLLFMHARIPVMAAVRVMWWSCVCDPKLEDRFCRNPAASNKFQCWVYYCDDQTNPNPEHRLVHLCNLHLQWSPLDQPPHHDHLLDRSWSIRVL